MFFNPSGYQALVAAIRKSKNSEDAKILVDAIEAISEYIAFKTSFDTKSKFLSLMYPETKKYELHLSILKDGLYACRKKADATFDFIKLMPKEYKTEPIFTGNSQSVGETYDFYVELTEYLREATDDRLILL